MKIFKLYMVILCLCLILTLNSCKKEDHIMENYPAITDNKHIIKELELKDLVLKIANKETFVVVLGFPACPWCQALLPELNLVGKELNLENIYYCDIKDARDNSESSNRIYYLALYEYFNEIVDQEKLRINAPTTLKITDGKLSGYHVDTVGVP